MVQVYFHNQVCFYFKLKVFRVCAENTKSEQDITKKYSNNS